MVKMYTNRLRATVRTSLRAKRNSLSHAAYLISLFCTTTLTLTALPALAAPSTPIPKSICVEHPEKEVCNSLASDPATSLGAGATSDTAPYTVSPVNFHPGHYMSVGYDSRNTFDRIANDPIFIGIKKLYNWRDLEPTAGVYDFSEIELDLARAQSLGKRLWISINSTTWNSRNPPKTPRYMWNNSKYGCDARYYGTWERSAQAGGWLPCIWQENVLARATALYSALGERFNNEPYFEGIHLPETSMGRTDKWGYTPAKQEDAFKRIALATKQAFPDKSVLQMINYAPFDLTNFAAWLADHHIGIGGPDVHLMSSKQPLLNITYPQYIKYHDVVPTGPDVQMDNYTRNTVTADQDNVAETILLGAIRHTNPWYMFWRTIEPYFTRDVRPTLRKYGQLPAASEFYNTRN